MYNINIMNNFDKKKLQELVDNNEDAVDNTDEIRKIKHSELIKNDINTFLKLKSNNKLLNIQDKCSFLHTNYPNILSKLVEDPSFDIKILVKLIKVLQDIENGLYNQHEGSAVVGQILKEIYVDPVLQKEERPKKEISYEDYKKMKQ